MAFAPRVPVEENKIIMYSLDEIKNTKKRLRQKPLL